MPVVGFIGKQGSGKTLSMIREALINSFKGMKIYSNVKLIGIPYERLDINMFYKYLISGKELHNVIVMIDELTLYADSRNFRSKTNKVIGYFALQTRKRDVKFFFTTQYLDTIDRRLRRCVIDDIVVVCHGIYKKGVKEKELIKIKQHIIHGGFTNVIKRVLNNPQNYYEYYNTGEVLPMLDE